MSSTSPILSLTVFTFLDALGRGAKRGYRHNTLASQLLQEAWPAQ